MSDQNDDNSNDFAQLQGQSAEKFAASLVSAIVIFAIEVFVFLLIKDRLARIYSPRTYLVPERERTKAVAPGWVNWIRPVLSTSNSEFVNKCGLDAYFFLRYLRMLLKIFVPAAIVILPILIPLNTIDGKGSNWQISGASVETNAANVNGLDQLSWANIKPAHAHRYWAHWILAFLLVCYVCYVAYDELRNYVRMRQAYITSPQHRLRASATTVLVSSIPDKWLSVEALEGLYDVFPGGIRNIWINRNFDELSAKIARRDKLARRLESAETNLIKKCFEKHKQKVLETEKAAGKKRTKQEVEQEDAYLDEKGRQQAQSDGLDSNNPHQIRHTVRDMLDERSPRASLDVIENQATDKPETSRLANVPVIGQGLHTIGHGFSMVGKGIVGGLRGASEGITSKVDTTNGFINPGTAESSAQHIRYSEDTAIHGDSRMEDASPRSVGGFNGTSEQAAAPQHTDNDLQPLTQSDSQPKDEPIPSQTEDSQEPTTTLQKVRKTLSFGKSYQLPVVYAKAYDEEFAEDSGMAIWRKHIAEKDRATMRLPIRGWMPKLPFVGPKVDTIYYCRKEIARLNGEIEDDQANPERFPFMNSAFVQFNHQVAAHMACQSVSHHLPKQMAPRLVEIDPSDVIWDNMSIPWWQTYIRTGAVVAIVTGMIVLWAVPVAFTSGLSQLSVAADQYAWLHWVVNLPGVVRAILQGVLSPALLALLMFLLPVILRYLSKVQGMQSGVLVELSVQKYYFFFQFIQIFLVVTIAGTAVGLIGYFKKLSKVGSIPQLLGQNVPRASNYFFSYMLLQAFSVSAGALAQVGGLFAWFVLAPILDSTARAKFRRQTNLSNIQWGTFFPVYTNLACIGLIYSVVSPLILVFNILTFSLFWFVYRYQTLYVTKFTMDTGGLLFPNAINTMFVGVYVMELVLIILFFLVRDDQGQVAAFGQAIGTIIMMILTAGYQILLNNAFSPLFQYIPITLEDDAVRRDEEFERTMKLKHRVNTDQNDSEDIEDRLEQQEKNSMDEDRQAHEYEMREIETDREERLKRAENPTAKSEELQLQNPEILTDIDRESKGMAFMRKTANKTADVTLHKLPGALNLPHAGRKRGSWADRSRNRRSSVFNAAERQRHDRYTDDEERPEDEGHGNHHHRRRKRSPPRQVLAKINNFNPIAGDKKDLEAQQQARSELADALFSGVSDELEDLTPDERDALVQRAFQHAALRARRPVIWIPRDDLGVSDDEVTSMGRFSKHIWVSNVRQGLDSRGRTVYSGAPPDFSEVDVIRL